MAICPFCRNDITSQEGFVVCPVCHTLYHDICWRQNGNRCGNLGCTGAGELPVFSVSQGRTYRPAVKTAQATQLVRMPTSVLPTGIGGKLTLAADLAAGALGWAFLSWAALSLVLAIVPFLPFGWQPRAQETGPYLVGALVAGCFGLIRAAKHSALERRRLLSAILGYVSFRLLAEALTAAYFFGGFGWRGALAEPAVVRSLAGPLGALLAGLWPVAAQLMFPVGLSALLGLYFADSLYFLWPDAQGWSVEVRLALIAILLGAAVIPLLMSLPLNGLLGAATALAPALLLLRTYHFNPSSVGAGSLIRYALLAILFAFPFAGLMHAHAIPRGSLRGPGLSLAQVWPPTKRGVWAASFVTLSVGLTALAAQWFAPLGQDLGAVVLPLASPLFQSSSLYVAWTSRGSDLLHALFLTYSAIFAVGRIARRGLFHVFYRFLRWACLTLVCCLAVIVIGRVLGVVLHAWPALRVFGEYPDWMMVSLYGMAMLLAIIFAASYAKDRVPFPLIGLGFTMWFLQMVLLTTVLSFLGGVLGLWLGRLVGPLLEAGNPQGVLGVPWGQAILIGGLLLGFIIGSGWFLVKWMGKDLGILVSQYRRVILKYAQLLDSRLDAVLDSFTPWWAATVLAIVALWAAWLFIQIMTPVLISRS